MPEHEYCNMNNVHKLKLQRFRNHHRNSDVLLSEPNAMCGCLHQFCDLKFWVIYAYVVDCRKNFGDGSKEKERVGTQSTQQLYSSIRFLYYPGKPQGMETTTCFD